MNFPKIAVVISTCSNEKQFFDKLIEQCRIFASQIIVSLGSSLHDGSYETEEAEYIQYLTQNETYRDILFVNYEVTKIIEYNPLKRRPQAFWANIARMAGAMNINEDIDWIMFIDGDEIPEGDIFKTWLENTVLDQNCSYKFANYWYFRDVIYQADQWEDSILMVPRKPFLDKETNMVLMQDDERDAIAVYFNCIRNVLSKEGKPMFHHFSWARTKKQILKKIQTWGHRDDKNWIELVEEMWSKPFDGRDCVHNYNYTIVPNVFSLLLSD